MKRLIISAGISGESPTSLSSACISTTGTMFLDVVLESEGTVDHAAVYPRQILKRVLDLGGTGVILAHNHPAGSLEPSEGDKALTGQIITGARALGVSIHDHLIVTHEGHFSFRQAGLL